MFCTDTKMSCFYCGDSQNKRFSDVDVCFRFRARAAETKVFHLVSADSSLPLSCPRPCPSPYPHPFPCPCLSLCPSPTILVPLSLGLKGPSILCLSRAVRFCSLSLEKCRRVLEEKENKNHKNALHCCTVFVRGSLFN